MEEVPRTSRLRYLRKLTTPEREVKPDVVSYVVPRYESQTHTWQGLGPQFDRASHRYYYLIRKPINFISGKLEEFVVHG